MIPTRFINSLFPAVCVFGPLVMAAPVLIQSGPSATAPTVAPGPAGRSDSKPLGETKKGVAIAIPAQINLHVGGHFTWKILTSAVGIETITGITVDQADREKPLSKVGDSLAARMWNDTGRLVVTAMTGSRELRVVFEPENGSYLCGKNFVVAQLGEGSTLQYWNQYTDFQPNADATELKTRQDMAKAVAAFKALAETKGISATNPAGMK